MTQSPALPATDSMLSRAVLAAVCLVALAASPAAAAPLGTAFTYQGVLKDMGTPQDGAFDFTFELYDNEFGGSQVGATVSLIGVVVTEGLFIVELDFGAVFDGTDLWLEIGVDLGSGNSVLSPRQHLTAAPFALYAAAGPGVLTPDWNDLINVPAGFADGTDDVGDDWNALTNVPAGFADGTDDVVDGDADASNEIQTLGGAGGELSLSLGGGSLRMSALTTPGGLLNAFRLDNSDNATLDRANLILDRGPNAGNFGRKIEIRGRQIFGDAPFAILDFSNFDNDNAQQDLVVARIDALNAGNTDTGALRFHTSPNGNASLAERVRITEEGKVGVGTETPDARLDVEDERCCAETGNPDRFIANVVNTSTNAGGPDVLWLQTSGVDNPPSNTYFIAFQDSNSRVGSVRGNGSGGVQFTTTGADYAEELEQLDASEVIAAGDVVGVFGGKISKRTEGSDWVTVVSGNSAFVGNVGDSSDSEGRRGTVAFMGQVRVKVRGPVAASDYIVASGLEDGTAVAVPPEEMRADPSRRIVGRAWEASEEEAVKRINTTIGLPGADATTAALARTVEDQRLRLEEQQIELSRLRAEVVEMRAAQTELAALRDRLDLLLRRDLVAGLDGSPRGDAATR